MSGKRRTVTILAAERVRRGTGEGEDEFGLQYFVAFVKKDASDHLANVGLLSMMPGDFIRESPCPAQIEPCNIYLATVSYH